MCACVVVGVRARKKKSMQTCKDFVARAKDSKPTNHIAETRKLNVN